MPDPSFKAAKADQPMTDKDQPLTNKDCIPNDIQQSYPISFSASSRQPGNKQDVQPRDNESLLCGTYNEADSRNSFLEALNEWRRAGASSSHDKPGQAAQATSTAGTSGKEQWCVSAAFDQNAVGADSIALIFIHMPIITDEVFR